MSPQPLSPIRKAWYKWKSLHLPWRKRFLIGLDLQGNTFWEFRDTLSSHKNRMRRIVQYPPATQYSDLNISPQWHQWLRHTRRDPPSIAEQSQDLVRQENLKVLARRADERWAAKASFLERPKDGRRATPTLGGTRSAMATPRKEEELGDTGVPQEAGWSGEVRARAPGAGSKDAVEDAAKEETPTMPIPDRQKHYFKGRPDGTRVKEKKYKDDPWKQARGAPSEDWQPAAWSPNSALKRQ